LLELPPAARTTFALALQKINVNSGVVFLASSAAESLAGQTIFINGGALMP